MEKNSHRSNRGLLVCLSVSEEGVVSVTLDDAVKQKGADASWRQDCFVTSKDYPEDVFDDLRFDEKELADFGYYILSRLHAFKQRDEL